MTILRHDAFEWPKRMDIEIKAEGSNGDSAGAMFETSISGFYVGLEVFLSARVKELQGIAPYLTANQNVPKRIKEEVTRLIRNTIHGTNPARFYLEYSSAETHENPTRKSFEGELREKIRQLLDSEFNSEILDLVLKPVATDFTRKLELVATRTHDFESTAALGTRIGAPEITVQGSFRIQHVASDGNGWRTFKNSEVSVEAITNRIQHCIRARLKNAPDDDSVFLEPNGLDEFIKETLLAAIQLISHEFGLAAEFTTVSWEWSGALGQFALEKSKEEVIAVHKRVARLKERRLELIENGADLEEIEEIDQSIARLSASLSPPIASNLGISQLPARSSKKVLPPAGGDQLD
jgi:hypothetical protein